MLELFRHGYARPTLLLWATFFVSLILLYFMVSWLPSLLQESGLTRNAANLATSMFLFAGTLGAMLLAWLADRLRSKVRLLAAILVGAALFTLLLGLNHDQPRWLLAFVFAAGFCIIGGQLTLNAFASNFYPAQVRATGTGWRWAWAASVRSSAHCSAACCWACTYPWRTSSCLRRFPPGSPRY